MVACRIREVAETTAPGSSRFTPLTAHAVASTCRAPGFCFRSRRAMSVGAKTMTNHDVLVAATLLLEKPVGGVFAVARKS